MKKQGRQSEINYLRTIKIGTPIFLILVLLMAVVWGVATLKSPKTLPFHHVKISASNVHIKIPRLKNVVIANLKGGFFSLKAQELRQALLALPWIAEVSFRRVWPDQLIINVTEQRAIARWGDELVNEKGQLFQPELTGIPKNLPFLSGPVDSLKEILKKYHQFSEASSTLGVTITALRLSKRHAWQLLLNGHINVMLGRDNVNQRFKRFINLYPRVVGVREKDVTRVDLRYPNGLAIKWQSKRS